MRCESASDRSATGWLDASQGADGTWVSYARSDGGAVTSSTSVAGTTAYSLDAAGRRTHLATPSAAFEFGYCGWNGRLAAVTNAGGFVVQYAYDIMAMTRTAGEAVKSATQVTRREKRKVVAHETAEALLPPHDEVGRADDREMTSKIVPVDI